MMLTRKCASTLRSLAAGAMLNAAAVGSALAAPSFTLPFALPFDITTLPARDILLWGSVALLVVALAAKIVQDRYRKEPVSQGPDLRWWKNPPPNPQS